MSEQLLLNFPFKKNYLSQDFYVSENNFNAYKLIESWPKWTSRLINIFGPKGCGKTHLINILNSRIQCIIVSAHKVNDKTLNLYKLKECLIIDNFRNDIDEKTLYSIINMGIQDNKYLIISSNISIKKIDTKLKDLNSRLKSFIDVGIKSPSDDLLRVILSKNFSDKQITVSEKNIDFILKNIERSYEKINGFVNFLDNLSLSKSKPINLQLIKKALNHLNT